MVTYDNARQFILSRTNLEAKIQAIDAIIDAFILSGADAAEKDGIQEYSLNDGQTIIKTIYRGGVGVANAMKYWESVRQTYVNRYIGRNIRLVDGKNFNRGLNGRF